MPRKRKTSKGSTPDTELSFGTTVLRGKCDMCGRKDLAGVYGMRLKSAYDPGHADICIECYACIGAPYMTECLRHMIDKKLPGLGKHWRGCE